MEITDLTVTRELGGQNPHIMAAEPLTAANPWVRMQITKYNKFIGLGLADQDFVLDKSSILGSTTRLL